MGAALSQQRFSRGHSTLPQSVSGCSYEELLSVNNIDLRNKADCPCYHNRLPSLVKADGYQ